MITSSEKDFVVFSKSKIEVYFVRNIFIILSGFSILLITLFLLFIVPTRGFSSLSFIVILSSAILLIILAFFLKIFFSKFTSKIILDHKEKTITIYSILERYGKKYFFKDLKTVYVNGYIYLTFSEEKFYYNDLSNTDLFRSLQQISNIKWGPLCKIFGPPSSFIKQLENEISS